MIYKNSWSRLWPFIFLTSNYFDILYSIVHWASFKVILAGRRFCRSSGFVVPNFQMLFPCGSSTQTYAPLHNFWALFVVSNFWTFFPAAVRRLMHFFVTFIYFIFRERTQVQARTYGLQMTELWLMAMQEHEDYKWQVQWSLFIDLDFITSNFFNF